MSTSSGKVSNYIGQAKDNKKMDNHFVTIDRDLQNLWRLVNDLTQYIALNTTSLTTNATLGFTYVPIMYNPPQATPTNYAGYAAFVFATSNSSLYIYNSSDTSWKVEQFT